MLNEVTLNEIAIICKQYMLTTGEAGDNLLCKKINDIF